MKVLSHQIPHAMDGDTEDPLLNRATTVSGQLRGLFTEEQVAMFEQDGFLVVSGLLEDEIEELVAAGETFVESSMKSQSYFSAIEMGMIFQAGKLDYVTQAFRKVALDSVLPRAAAELMRLPTSSRVRVLR